MSLLEEAQKLKKRKNKRTIYTQDEVELVMAWVDEKIGLTQVQRVIKINTHFQTYSFIAEVLKYIIQNNKLEKKPNNIENYKKSKNISSQKYIPLTFKKDRKCKLCGDLISDQSHKARIFCSDWCKNHFHHP